VSIERGSNPITDFFTHLFRQTNMSDATLNVGQAERAFEVLLSNVQSRHGVDGEQLIAAARAVLQESDFSSAMISLAVVDDEAMRELNRQFLNHDYPTDVLSFALQEDGSHLEGEVIISADTAAAVAAELGCAPAAEQLLYVVHGMLHLVGYRDKTSAEAQRMRIAEAQLLGEFGWGDALQSNSDSAEEDTSKPKDSCKNFDSSSEHGRREGTKRAVEVSSPAPLPKGERCDAASHDAPNGANRP
jgi:probable rRNA maturation factor